MEKLFLIDDQRYLHVQECDEGGYDYTFYDRKTYKAVDGGRLDDPEGDIDTILQAALYICYNHGLAPDMMVAASEDMIETLQAAN